MLAHESLLWLQEKKKGLRAELNALNNKRDELRAQIRDLKTKVGPYPTVQKLDDRIRQQEFEITHSSMNLKDENKVGVPAVFLP